MLRSRSPSGRNLVAVDDLPALEVLIERILAASDGAAELGCLLDSAPPSSDTGRVSNAANQGIEALERGVDLMTCCSSVRALVSALNPPLFAKKSVPKLKKDVQRAHNEKAATQVAELLRLPSTKHDTTDSIQRAARAADFTASLLHLLTRVGLATNKSPLDIATVSYTHLTLPTICSV